MADQEFSRALGEADKALDPFHSGTHGQVYYPEPSRTQRLNLLLSMLQYGEVILVKGAKGQGKTTLVDQLIKQAGESVRLSSMRGAAGVNADDIIHLLCDGLTLSGGDGLSSWQWVAEQMADVKKRSQACVLLVDDAHRLSAEALQSIGHLAIAVANEGSSALTIILLAEESIETRFFDHDMKGLKKSIAHRFDLASFSEEETGEYIKHRLISAGFQNSELFTQPVIKVIHKNSGGVPGSINELSSVVINSSQQYKQEGDLIKWIKNHTTVLGLGFGLLMLVFFVVRPLVTTPLDETLVAAQQPRVGEPLTLPKEQRRVHRELARLEKSEVVAEQASPPVAKVVSPTVIDVPQELPQKASPAVEVEAETSAKPKQPPSQPKPVDSAKKKEIAVATKTEPPPVATTSGVNVKASKVININRPKNKQRPKRLVNNNNGVHTEAWVNQLNPNSYTLQLLAMRDKKILMDYIKRHRLQGDVAYYKTLSKGQVFYALIVGVYASHGEALNAAEQLKQKIKRVNPWARSLKGVQSAIKKAQ